MYNTIVTLKKGEGRTLKAGGAWVYDNEIDSIMGSFENGDIVTVHDFDGYFLGYGFINTKSKITVRILSRKKDTVIDDAFLEERVQAAWDYRKQVIDTGSCRLIFGEADFLPGIVVDKFADVLVVESLALGIDRMKDWRSWTAGKESTGGRRHYRSGASMNAAMPRCGSRRVMPRQKGFIGEPFDTRVEIVENGVQL